MPKCREPRGGEPGGGARLCFAVTFPPLANALARGRAEPDNFHLPMSPGLVLRTASFELPARVLPILSRGHTCPALHTSAPWFPSIGLAAPDPCAARCRCLSRTYRESRAL